MSDKEMALMRETFDSPEKLLVMFKFLVTMESDKGVQMSYDLESIQTHSDITDAEVRKQIDDRKRITKWARMKMLNLLTFIKEETQEEIDKEEKDKEEKAEILERKKEENRKEEELEEAGVGENI